MSLRIQERISRLTRSEQKLAKVILASPTIIETHSATELAALANVSKATTARFFRALGYADFEEVKVQAREERDRTQPYSYSVSPNGNPVLGRKISEHLELELVNLNRTFEEMDPDALRQASRMIADAPRVWFLGLDSNIWFARYARAVFLRLRHNVNAVNVSEGTLAEDLAMMGPRDVLIVMAQGPQSKDLNLILSHARTTRVNIIMITDHTNLAQAKRFADMVLRCHIANYGLIETHTTMVSLLRLLAVSYVGHVGEAAVRRAGLIDDINEELERFG
ncbi:MurR/RpiR family transcriptional regulator [Roseovarius sp. A46]|uniref:MurR/RpiR family transcriptional regulator n=1 Tax=Roseovarius sp. A46 TaxID=2109331 RepID=UPI00240EB7D2|nr:MurR/RpiR family transcriptional regulator [Roseovarius sp. A46]